MSKDGINSEFLITLPGNKHWTDIAELIASAVPNALASTLGPRFGALYYENISNHPLSCSYVALDKTGRLAGVILGTLDYKSSKPLGFALKIKLFLAANLRLFSPAVLRWILTGLRFRGRTKCQMKNFPKAQLKTIVVHEDFRGNGLANQLINELESFFKKNNQQKPYVILTEKSNRVANNLYEKLGATLITAYPYHDKIMHAWHKSLS